MALENRFIKTQNGNIYSTTVCDYNFWKRYLHIFDEVGVFGRLSEVDEELIDKPLANGPGVHFVCPVNFIGPWQYLKKRGQLNTLAKRISEQYDAFILRVPGTMASLLWHHLRAKKKPYGVEVVGDPWDSYGPGSVKSILRPIFRRKSRKDMVSQCRRASVASYVTKYSLQKRYPPGCWSTHYSSINLPDTAFIEEKAHNERIKRIKAKQNHNGPWRICHIGMMEHLYKAPDVLIDAVADCIKKGINIELALIGDGHFKAQLQKQVDRLGISDKVNFLGKLVPGGPVFKELDKSDLYVLPSRQEGLPRTIIEAMARGVPCIASNVGGIKELLLEEHMVSPGNAEPLANKIMTVITNPVKMQKMATQNLKKSKKYCSSELDKRRKEFYKKVIEVTKTNIAHP